ncbi:MAG: hypothetical protein H7233_04605 [Pseudorhodobacter sp.]|nr:hypothetical protein [Frankiaceae bacterium]
MITNADRAGQCVGAGEGVVTRRQLQAAGVPRWWVRNELARGRWQRIGRQVVVAHNGPVDAATRRAAAVLEVGSRAALDGVASLQHAGLTGLTDTRIDVITPKSSTPLRPAGVKVHESRRFREQDVLGNGVRRTTPAVAAVHAALWAVSDPQATLFVVMTVQQRLATVAQLRVALLAVRRHRRRAVLDHLLVELAAGAQSLGERDVATGPRQRGPPVPTRQVVRQGASRRQYLDLEWEAFGLVVEVDGAGHGEAAQQLADVLRDLAVAADGQTPVRIPLTAWVLDEEAVLDALEILFRSRGWLPVAA